ncbi:MAG: patatin-like phospholipase family protein, partial [Ketobacter sp.]
MWQRLTWAIMFVWWHSAAVHAEIVVPENAKIGLVLSGGGARGLAHVGVIRVLESQGIKPDIITGTSMGSIVGALYATGRSAEEIDRLARNMNWRDALSDASPRRHQPYPFRQLEAGMTADFRMSISPNGITFPRGVIEGQHLEQVLGELFEQQGRALTFEQLPIQFAAVAADLETGEQVVLDSGDVTSAIRASMSIPGALAPVQRDGRLLVDGGIANNMPVDLAR